jgi:hypothetical protein
MPAGVRQSRPTGRCWPAVWSHARRRLSGNGRRITPWDGSLSETYLPVVTGVAVIGDHALRLLFSDGTVGDVVFSARRWTGILEPLNDPAYFSQVTLDAEAGTITWPDGIDPAPEPLYEQALAHPLVAA